MSISPEALHRANDRISALERELEIVTASLTDQETENERLREQLAEARAREGQYREAWAAARKTLPPDPSLNAPWSQCIAFMDEALATPAPRDLTEERMDCYQFGEEPAPSTGEAERLKALGNAEQIAADRAANTTDPREAAVASRIANDIKQLRE